MFCCCIDKYESEMENIIEKYNFKSINEQKYL